MKEALIAVLKVIGIDVPCTQADLSGPRSHQQQALDFVTALHWLTRYSNQKILLELDS